MKSDTKIKGLRFQKYDTGEVHIHDDTQNLKFVSDVKTFKKEIADGLKVIDTDGIAKIKGNNGMSLYLCKEGKIVNIFVVNDVDISGDLNAFIKSL